MAKKISSSDLFDQEDIFKGIRDSASKTIETLQSIQNELKDSAKVLQNDLKNSSVDSAKGLKDFTSAAEAASKVMKEAAIVAEKQAKAEQQKIKADQELVKLEKLKAQETARANKEAEKAAKLSAQESSAYAKLSKELNTARKAYKDLAVTNQTNTKEAQDLLSTINKLDDQLKEVDATVGQHQRNVGNYESATKSLKLQLRELTQALQQMETSDPRFQEMTQQAAELKDRIDDTGATIRATAGNAVENLAGSFVQTSQIGVAAFQGVEASMALFGVESENVQKSLMRLTALMNLSDSLKTLGELDQKFVEIRASITAFGSKAIGAFNGMSKAGKAFAVTGIGLLILAVGLLIENFDKLGSIFTASTAKAKAFEKSTHDQAAAARQALEDFDEYERTLKRLGYTEDTIEEKRKKRFKDAIEKTKKEIEASKSVYKEQLKNLETVKTFDNLGLNATGRALFGDEEEAKAQRDKVTDLRKTLAKLKNDEFQFEQDIKNAKKEKEEAIKKENEERLKAFREKAQQELDELNGYLKEATKQNREMAMTDEEIQIAAVKEKYARRIALAKKYGKDTTQLEIAMLNEINDIKMKKENEYMEIERKAREEANRLKIEQENAFKDEIERIQEENYQRGLTDQEKEIQSVNDKYFELETKAQGDAEALKQIEMAKMNELNDINLKYQEIDYKNKEEKAKKDEELAKEAKKKEWETTQEFAQKTTDFLIEQSDKRIAALDKEIEAAEKQSDVLKNLAENGNIQAQQSLAEQERIIAESNLRKQQEQKKQQRIQLANSVFSTYASKVEAGSKNALAETIRDTTLLQAFINSIPAFYDGTEDTGSGGGLDGKGGFHAVLHPHERVLPKSLNDRIGSMSNEDLTRIAQEYQNGRLMRQDVAHSSMDLALLVNEMKDLKQVIKNKPETNIALGEITQSAMEIVERSRKGNTTVYNRFKVRK
jgi:myosin heavy subunit